jgi:hypothetical protein
MLPIQLVNHSLTLYLIFSNSFARIIDKKMKIKQVLFTLAILGGCSTYAQDTIKQFPPQEETPVKAEKKWYDKFSIRGYVQTRYNNLLNTNENLGCEQCDKSWGGNGGFFLRRARVVFSGQIHKNVYFYIQPDFASSASSTSLHFGQLRDAYVDVGFDADNEYRVRIGQSKIPYGFENMQSSQNRLPLDRNDGMNSAFANERDLGVFFYWAPKETRELFSMLVKENYKGSGDYGVVGVGLFNGQTANKPEMNDESHVVARVSYPFKIGSQIIEPGIQGYSGNYTMFDAQLSDGVITNEKQTYIDRRAAVSFILYPRPFGIQAEYNIGEGPEFDKETQSIMVKPLEGGYVTLNYRIENGEQFYFPFARYHYYRGGKKHETDARSYAVNELELGLEWQFNQYFELVAMYTISNRRYEDFSLQDNKQEGSLLRLQAQFNF